MEHKEKEHVAIAFIERILQASQGEVNQAE